MTLSNRRRLSRRWESLLGVALMLAGCAPSGRAPAAPGASADTQPIAGDTLVTGSIGDARTLIPILASDGSSADICGLVFNGLVKYAPDLTLVGDLAERWDIEENGLVIIFHLRHGVAWHDGHPFTAADVRFTYAALINPQIPTPYGSDFERVQSLEVIDDYTVRVRYKAPFAPGLASWSMSIMPKHLLEHADLQTTPFARNPIGTGPYRFHRWKTGEMIELTANPSYFEHRPQIDRYLYRIIPDQAVMFLEASVQQLDWLSLTPLQYRRQIDTPFFKQNYRTYRYPSQSYVYLGYNLKDPRFADKHVRQALNYAINKDELIDGVLMGLGRISTGPFLPESWAYNPDAKPAPYDPAKAKALLKEAGWEDRNGDGWLEKDGKKFSFTILTNQGNQIREYAAEIIQRRLRDIGIDAAIRPLEWSVFISRFVNTQQFEAILLGWGLGYEPDPYAIFHSSQTKPGQFNFVHYSNHEVDCLIEEGRRTFDQEKRKQIYRRIHELIYEDQPYTFLFVPDATPIVHARFRNVVATAIGIGYNLIDWYVPKLEQRYPNWRIEP